MRCHVNPCNEPATFIVEYVYMNEKWSRLVCSEHTKGWTVEELSVSPMNEVMQELLL